MTVFLEGVPLDLRLRLLAELVCIDLEHRLQNKLPVALDDYFREFPELERLPPADRADLESHARQRSEELSVTVDYGSPAAKRVRDVPAAIGRFPIAGRLGSGGQADALLSFHPDLQIPVVVKWHHAQEPSDTTRRERLVQEGRILAGLKAHPNLVRVYDIGFHEERAFLVLDHIQGQTLDKYLADERPDPREAAEFVAALAEAVHAAHEQGVIHQDINPRNVLIDGRGQPRLIDFGLAWFQSSWADTVREEQPIGGTPEYLSPEQADPAVGPITRRTDVFGLGGVLYFLLTGKPLYQAMTCSEAILQAARGAYDPRLLPQRGVPRQLAAVCRKALARDPQDRFATAAELATALRRATRRPPWRRVAVLTGLLLAALVAGWLIGQPSRHGTDSVAKPNRPTLEVRVWRPKTRYTSLREALPVKTGDELQVRFRVPAGVHVALCSINGNGRLSLLQQYPPQNAATELIYPGPDQTRGLEPPAGTELLLVCGRIEGPLKEHELKAAWESGASWPALKPPQRLLRLQPAQVREEGERPRDFGATHNREESDAVARRLDAFRDRLLQTCTYFEGLAFVHNE